MTVLTSMAASRAARRAREASRVEVPVEVEGLVVGPHRPGDAERRLDQLLAVARDQVQARGQALAHRLVRNSGPAFEDERRPPLPC
jgi:hypothetical protein